MEFNEFRDGIYTQWQKSMIKLCWWGSFVIGLFEVLIFLAYLRTDFLVTSVGEYLIIRVIGPSSINFITSIICTVILRSNRFTVVQKNHAVTIALWVIGTVVSVVHNYYKFLLVAIGLPILICAIFADRKILRNLVWLCLGSFIAAITAIWFDDVKMGVVDFVCTSVCAFMFILIVYFISKRMVDYQAEQINFIYNSNARQAELIQELKIEPLTKLYNRNALNGAMHSFVEKFEAGICVPHLVLLDLDHFKEINDTYGHAEGDSVLIALADVIKKDMEGIRRAFRYGGEEFVLLFDAEGFEQVYETVERIRKDFGSLEFNFAPGKHFTLSAGIAKIESGGDDTTWFNSADAAMYKAKENGRNRIEVADNL